MPIRSWISLITGKIDSKHPELFALEFGKIAEYDFVYTLSSTNIDQSALNIYKYGTISTILGQNVCDHKISDDFDYGSNRTSYMSALELENLTYLTFFTL